MTLWLFLHLQNLPCRLLDLSAPHCIQVSPDIFSQKPNSATTRSIRSHDFAVRCSDVSPRWESWLPWRSSVQLHSRHCAKSQLDWTQLRQPNFSCPWWHWPNMMPWPHPYDKEEKWSEKGNAFFMQSAPSATEWSLNSCISFFEILQLLNLSFPKRERTYNVETIKMHNSWMFWCFQNNTQREHFLPLAFKGSSTNAVRFALHFINFPCAASMVRFRQISSEFLQFTVSWLWKFCFVPAYLHFGENCTSERKAKQWWKTTDV